MKRKFCLTYGKVFKPPQCYTNRWGSRNRYPAQISWVVRSLFYPRRVGCWGKELSGELSALPKKGFLNSPRNIVLKLAGLAELLGHDEYPFLSPWVVFYWMDNMASQISVCLFVSVLWWSLSKLKLYSTGESIVSAHNRKRTWKSVIVTRWATDSGLRNNGSIKSDIWVSALVLQIRSRLFRKNTHKKNKHKIF